MTDVAPAPMAWPASAQPASAGRPRDPYWPWRQSLLPAERVRELSQLRPWRVVVDTAVAWALIVLAWAAVARWPGWWSVLLALPVIGSRYYALFIIGHDGMHRRLFRRRWLNDLWNDLLCHGPIGAVTHVNNRNHLRHHQYLATELDPDRHKHACFNKVEHHELLGFLAGATGLVRTARNVFRPSGGSPVRADGESSGGHTIRDLVILLMVQAAIAGGLTAAIGWWAYPVLWLLPVYLFAYLADNLRSFAEHSQPGPDGPADAHRLISYRSNPVERWFLAPHHMNLHAAHHLWPSIPYYRLPEADAEIRGRADPAALEWRGSYLGYLLRYWRAQPLEECRRGR